MSAARALLLACAGLFAAAPACGPSGDSGNVAAARADAGPSEDKDDEVPEQPRLAAGQIRVALVVLPGDADVEVEGAAVRRRDGLVEIVGKAGDKRRVRVVQGADAREFNVTLHPDGAEPPLLDLLAPPEAHGAGPGDAGTAAPAVDPLLPESFE